MNKHHKIKTFIYLYRTTPQWGFTNNNEVVAKQTRGKMHIVVTLTIKERPKTVGYTSRPCKVGRATVLCFLAVCTSGRSRTWSDLLGMQSDR